MAKGLTLSEYVTDSVMCDYMRRNGWTVMTFTKFLKRFGYTSGDDIYKRLGIQEGAYQSHVAWKTEEELKSFEFMVSKITHFLENPVAVDGYVPSVYGGIYFWYTNWESFMSETFPTECGAFLSRFLVRVIFMQEVRSKLREIIYGPEL